MSTLFSPIYVTQIAYTRGCWSRPLGEKKEKDQQIAQKGKLILPQIKTRECFTL